MKRCERLKAARIALGLSQKEFAKLVGLSHYTMWKLENDETSWAVMTAPSVDKIDAFFERYETGSLTESVPANSELTMHDDSTVVDEVIEPVVDVEFKIVSSNLTQIDLKSLTLIEFTYESLSEAKTHDEFVANINMLRRILAKY